MKTSTKWILGIVIGVVVFGILAAVGYVVYNQWDGGIWVMGTRGMRVWERGRVMPMHPNWGQPIQRFDSFSPLRWIGGFLIFLGLLALIALGIVVLVRTLSRPRQPIATAAPASTVIQEPAPTNSCPNCQRAVQNDWSHCPYCGQTL